MNRKTFLVIALFVSIIAISTFSFAAETMNGIKNSLGTMGRAAGDMVGTAAESVENGISDLANGTKNMAENISRDDTRNDTEGMLGIQNEDSNYTATRTATSNNNNLLGLSSNSWLWIIMGIVGAIIVALVWYYGSQYENRSYDHNR